jgi:hypothetical protein
MLRSSIIAAACAAFAHAAMPCPGSAVTLHAKCEVTGEVSGTCAVVMDEVSARVAGQYDLWHDPHNNGTYSGLSTSGTQMSLQRRTGNDKYTDKMVLAFTGRVAR